MYRKFSPKLIIKKKKQVTADSYSYILWGIPLVFLFLKSHHYEWAWLVNTSSDNPKCQERIIKSIKSIFCSFVYNGNGQTRNICFTGMQIVSSVLSGGLENFQL